MESILQIKRGKKMYEGKVTYEEGDLLQAVFDEKVDLPVGDPVSCMITRNFEQMHTFEGVILAKDDNKLIVFHSPTAKEFKEQRRRYPRFEVNLKGWIRLPGTEQEKSILFYPSVELVNISLGGLAFRFDQKIPLKARLPFYTELYGRGREDGEVKAHLEVTHAREDEGAMLYGCKIVEIDSKNLLTLRKYLLQRQLEELKNMS
ncbi:PilZ domain-containing protein [Brevibacillus sp. SYP-B805]|uniref:PilZ domain-containing protein n=1 Tax=Brevibacillus sp. SYP-B805 TaxID=1578199 RepID=UPI0013ED056E|nr:PilZ domain-containing protein [Brevibacillus sp. SYP-B805]NGQ96670.1 PilZ domain-containing protein [Brevibacillus sp. SYP-B805]